MNSHGLLDALFATPAMAEIFSDRARLQGMLDFEAALARAEARVGVIPAAAVAAIAAKCRAELFDAAQLAGATAYAGNPLIPLVNALTAAVAQVDPAASGYVHWGATSQDAMDTGLMLQLRGALELIDADLARLSAALARLAAQHKGTVMAGRTWLQHGLPTTFGLKAAGWLDAVERHRARLHECRARVLAVQLGGAVGSLAALGDKGIAVVAAVAEELKLACPDLPWHAERDRVAEAATTLGLLVGTLGKIARDVSLLMQSEVGEAFEPAAAGRGGSSAMPQKRNPVGCAAVLAAALRVPALVSVMLTAMVQEHERGLGGWHAEWETLPQICLLAGGALAQTATMLEALEIDAVRMRENLDAGGGRIYAAAVAMALAPHLGARPAHRVVEEACRRAANEDRSLRQALAEDPRVRAHLAEGELDRLFDPAGAVGPALAWVERVLAARAERK